jgi:hypothetical protein
MTKRPQTIFRNNGASQFYTVISNSLLQDARISHETKGLLCELLSRPLDWEITIQSIWQNGASGRDKVIRMVAEAVKWGYVKTDRERNPDGTHGVRYYTVSDVVEPPPGNQALVSHTLESRNDNIKSNKTSKARARELIEDEEGISGEGWSLSWPQIDGLSAMYNLTLERGRQMARSLGLEWCRDGAPRSAGATLRRAMMAEELHAQKARSKPVAGGTIRPAQECCEHGFQASSCSACRTKARKRAASGKLQ